MSKIYSSEEIYNIPEIKNIITEYKNEMEFSIIDKIQYILDFNDNYEFEIDCLKDTLLCGTIIEDINNFLTSNLKNRLRILKERYENNTNNQNFIEQICINKSHKYISSIIDNVYLALLMFEYYLKKFTEENEKIQRSCCCIFIFRIIKNDYIVSKKLKKKFKNEFKNNKNFYELIKKIKYYKEYEYNFIMKRLDKIFEIEF